MWINRTEVGNRTQATCSVCGTARLFNPLYLKYDVPVCKTCKSQALKVAVKYPEGEANYILDRAEGGWAAPQLEHVVKLTATIEGKRCQLRSLVPRPILTPEDFEPVNRFKRRTESLALTYYAVRADKGDRSALEILAERVAILMSRPANANANANAEEPANAEANAAEAPTPEAPARLPEGPASPPNPQPQPNPQPNPPTIPAPPEIGF